LQNTNVFRLVETFFVRLKAAVLRWVQSKTSMEIPLKAMHFRIEIIQKTNPSGLNFELQAT
jgi:hypothetical protein